MAEQQGIAWEDVLSAADASQSVVIQPLPPEELARLQEAAAAAPTAAAGA
jgi:ferredoxin